MPYARAPSVGTLVRYGSPVGMPPAPPPPWTAYPHIMELVCRPSASFVVIDGRVSELAFPANTPITAQHWIDAP